MIDIGIDYNRVKNSYYKKETTNPILIDEMEESGKAKLEVFFPVNAQLTYIKLGEERTDWLQFAENSKCADGIVIQLDSSNVHKAKVFIFELKTSLSSSTWSKVLKQFRGAVLRALSFCSTVGIQEIEDICFFTAYVDSSSIDRQLDAQQAKQRIQGVVSRKRMTGMKYGDIYQWGESSIHPFPKSQMFAHQTIKLNHVNGVNIGSITI